MTWFTYSLIATALFAGYDLLSRVLSVKSINPVIFSGIFYVITAIASLLLFFFFPLEIVVKEIAGTAVFYIIASVIVWSLFGRLEYVAKKKVEVSTFLIIIKFAPVVTLLLSVVFLGEKMSLLKSIAVVLTIAANLLITSEGLKIKWDKGIILSLMTALFLGTAWVLDKVASPYFSLPFYSFLGFFFPGFANLFIPPVGWKPFMKEMKTVSWLPTIALAIANSVGYVLMIKAMSVGEVSNVVLVVSMAAVIAIILGIVVLGERKNVWKKLVAGLMVFVAALLLG